MSKLKFTAEMFSPIHGLEFVIDHQRVSDTCNRIFDKWLSDQPMVYASGVFTTHMTIAWSRDKGSLKDDRHNLNWGTHSARLVDIQEIEIEKAVCGHGTYSQMYDHTTHEFKFICFDCKEIIKPTKWEIAE